MYYEEHHTYCVLPMFLPIPFHPLLELFIHGLQKNKKKQNIELILSTFIYREAKTLTKSDAFIVI